MFLRQSACAALAFALTALSNASAQDGAGSDVEFLRIDDAGHFFLRDPELAAMTRERVDGFLEARDF